MVGSSVRYLSFLSCSLSYAVGRESVGQEEVGLVSIALGTILEELCLLQANLDVYLLTDYLGSVSCLCHVSDGFSLLCPTPSLPLRDSPSVPQASRRVLCTASPAVSVNPARPSPSLSWVHSSRTCGKHCGSRFGRGQNATTGELQLHCSRVRLW